MSFSRRTPFYLLLISIGGILLSFGIIPDILTELIAPQDAQALHFQRTVLFFRNAGIVSGILLTVVGILCTSSNGREWFSALLKRIWSDSKLQTLLILIGGAFFRFYHLIILGLGSPYKYGGLYWEFANQIAKNNFVLPKVIPYYTKGGLPFAYPPLAFYLEAIVRAGGAPASFGPINLIPPIFSLAAFAPFYFCVKSLGFNGRRLVFASAGYAFLPIAFYELIQAAGIAESVGNFMFLWLIYFMIKSVRSPSWISFVGFGIFLALSVVSSPGSAYAGILFSVLTSLTAVIYHQKWRVVGQYFGSVLLAVALSSPYWLTVVRNHGFGVFYDTYSAQHATLLVFINKTINHLMNFRIIHGHEYSFIWHVMIALGLGYFIIKKQVVPVVAFLITSFIPRESTWLVAIPSALMAGIGFEGMVVIVEKISRDRVIVGRCFLTFIAFILLLSPLKSTLMAPFGFDSYLSEDIQDTMRWLGNQTDPERPVVVLAQDHFLEWLPALSQRTVLNMPFGSEWQPEEMAEIDAFQKGIERCEAFDCVNNIIALNFAMSQYTLVIQKKFAYISFAPEDLESVWENDAALVFYIQ